MRQKRKYVSSTWATQEPMENPSNVKHIISKSKLSQALDV